MALHIFIAEHLRGVPVGGELLRIFPGDLFEFRPADLRRGEIVVVPAGVAVPGEKLLLSVHRPVSAAEAHQVGDHPKIIIAASAHVLPPLLNPVQFLPVLSVYLQPGKPEHPQNCVPAFAPFFAVRSTSFFPQRGQSFSFASVRAGTSFAGGSVSRWLL